MHGKCVIKLPAVFSALCCVIALIGGTCKPSTVNSLNVNEYNACFFKDQLSSAVQLTAL